MTDATITHVVVPGTFDPVTFGHLDVIRRARRLFPRVTVAVAASANKHGRGTTFTLEERVEMIREAIELEGLPADIDVQPFTGLLVCFCAKIGAGGVVKGLRAMTDFEYELQQADLNSHMAPDLESVFVMSSRSTATSRPRSCARSQRWAPTSTSSCRPTSPRACASATRDN